MASKIIFILREQGRMEAQFDTQVVSFIQSVVGQLRSLNSADGLLLCGSGHFDGVFQQRDWHRLSLIIIEF